MSVLIVYYSLEGNTDYAARIIASNTDADLLRLEPVKEYPRSGFRKYLWGGKSAVMAETPKLSDYEFTSDNYDVIVIGFPVWAGNVAPPVRTFLKENSLRGKRIAAFACQSGAGADKAFRKLKSALGIDNLEAELVLIDPKSKPDVENERKIAEFCDRLIEFQ